ncbi:hypothetical protein [Thioclava kandeliae]|uniref:Uncharacterized protein n=1 Tax=Thioclava kandeliae TaxID=3070818 RepID=A0ABV1SH30_9RHOB
MPKSSFTRSRRPIAFLNDLEAARRIHLPTAPVIQRGTYWKSISLRPEVFTFVDTLRTHLQARTGYYLTPTEIIAAALSVAAQRMTSADFSPYKLDGQYEE